MISVSLIYTAFKLKEKVHWGLTWYHLDVVEYLEKVSRGVSAPKLAPKCCLKGIPLSDVVKQWRVDD